MADVTHFMRITELSGFRISVMTRHVVWWSARSVRGDQLVERSGRDAMPEY